MIVTKFLNYYYYLLILIPHDITIRLPISSLVALKVKLTLKNFHKNFQKAVLTSCGSCIF